MSAKPWAEPGIGVEERRREALWPLAADLLSMGSEQAEALQQRIDQALLAAYLDGVKAAAKACEDLADRLPAGCPDQAQARYYASHVRSATPRAPAAALKADAP